MSNTLNRDRSPYAKRLRAIGFHLVAYRNDADTIELIDVGEQVFAAFGPGYQVFVFEAFEAIRRSLDTNTGMYCHDTCEGISGVFIHEFTRQLWFRPEPYNPVRDDSSLDLVNVSLEASNRKLQPRPPTSE